MKFMKFFQQVVLASLSQPASVWIPFFFLLINGAAAPITNKRINFIVHSLKKPTPRQRKVRQPFNQARHKKTKQNNNILELGD